MSWMRLDTDFARDPKMVSLVKHKGKGFAFDLVRLWCACTENDGQIDLNDVQMRDWLEDSLGFKGKRLRSFLSELSEYGLIDHQRLEAGIVTSDRLKAEADTARSYREQKQRAAKARWEKAKNDAHA